jgi:hypothetical protein
LFTIFSIARACPDLGGDCGEAAELALAIMTFVIESDMCLNTTLSFGLWIRRRQDVVLLPESSFFVSSVLRIFAFLQLNQGRAFVHMNWQEPNP